jgi:hypothetical protein
MVETMRMWMLLGSHLAVGAAGFALGVYALPILIAPASPVSAELASQTASARYVGQFRRNLEDSDALHWGEGRVSIGTSAIAFEGRLAPGPDYKLYLSPEFVETEAEFRRLKPTMVRVGDVKTFENFLVPLPGSIDPSRFNAVIVWCETFDQFITAARYQ